MQVTAYTTPLWMSQHQSPPLIEAASEFFWQVIPGAETLHPDNANISTSLGRSAGISSQASPAKATRRASTSEIFGAFRPAASPADSCKGGLLLPCNHGLISLHFRRCIELVQFEAPDSRSTASIEQGPVSLTKPATPCFDSAPLFT